MHNLVFATVHEWATGIRQRQVSATEVLEAHLTQIARHNPGLNAIVTLDEERARRRAQEADAALARGAPRGVRHMPQMGPLARSVANLTLTLRLIAEPDGQEWEVPPVALESAPDRPLQACPWRGRMTLGVSRSPRWPWRGWQTSYG